MDQKTLVISEELFNAIQQLKEVFWQMTWNTGLSDEEVLWILVWGFIQSLNEGAYHDVQNDHHHDHDGCCGGHWDEWHECKWDGSCENKKSGIIMD